MGTYTQTMSSESREQILAAIPLTAFALLVVAVVFFHAHGKTVLVGLPVVLIAMIVVYGFLIKDPQRSTNRLISAVWVAVGNLFLLDAVVPASVRWFRYASVTIPLIGSMLLPPEKRSTITLLKGMWLGLVLGNIAYSMLK